MLKKYLVILCLAMLLLAACSDNLFGSPGGSSDCKSDIACLRLDAENYFRDKQYKKAHETYSKIVALDSTASVGYFGMAKAGLWMKGVNPFDVFRFVTIEDDEIPFVGKDDSIKVKNRYLQAMLAVSIPLNILDRREKLTALYEIHKADSLSWVLHNRELDTLLTPIINTGHQDSIKNLKSLKEQLTEFRNIFCGGSYKGICKDTVRIEGSPEYAGFPLSDREYTRNAYSGGLIISFVAENILNILDINGDGCITKRGVKGVDNPGDPIKDSLAWANDWGCVVAPGRHFSYDLNINITKDSAGNFTIDYNQVLSDVTEQLNTFIENQDDERCNMENAQKLENLDYCALPVEVGSLNDKIEEFATDLTDVKDLLESFGMGEDIEDSLGAGDVSYEEEIDKYKEYVSFFRVGTRIDEDGDGCIDEDLLDGMDGDGDGIKGSNARFASTSDSIPMLWGKTNMMGYHSMTGIADNDKPIKLKAPVYVNNSVDGSKKSTLWPVDESETDSVTVIAFTQLPGYWTSDDMDLKLAVAQDTVCGQLEYNLEDRKALIGGCWLFYDETKFIDFALKRKSARDPSRIHPSCKTCDGSACSTKKTH